METKQCKECSEIKPIWKFYKSKNVKSGRYNKCKTCMDAYTRQWIKDNPEKRKIHQETGYKKHGPAYFAKHNKKWRESHKDRYNKTVYNWYEKNTDKWVETQYKYQSKIPPSVYIIKYKDIIVYVGSSTKPLRRKNCHFSTITTGTNLSKINKLHSYYGYKKDDFTFELIEEVKDEMDLRAREAYYEYKFNAKANYTKTFGKLVSVKERHEEMFGSHK